MPDKPIPVMSVSLQRNETPLMGSSFETRASDSTLMPRFSRIPLPLWNDFSIRIPAPTISAPALSHISASAPTASPRARKSSTIRTLSLSER